MDRRALALPLIGVLACASGCSGGESKEPTAAESAAASARQLARSWVDEVNTATTSGETERLRSLGTITCEGCLAFPQRLDEIYGNGGRVDTKDWQVEKIVPEAKATADRVGMLVTIRVPPQQVYPSAGASPSAYPGGEQAFRMVVVRRDGQWKIASVTPR